MWKDSYKIGVEVIDKQHMGLFQMTEDLIKAINGNADMAVFKKSISFLRSYVVNHFQDEEAYQESVGYAGIELHKAQHQEFTETVLNFEERLAQSGYAISVVKELAGLLTAWLIYHVADADRKIVEGVKQVPDSCPGDFSIAMMDVLEKMAGLDASGMKRDEGKSDSMEGDVFVEIELVGGAKGAAYFGFTKELAFQLIETMTFMIPETIDELVCSALAELSNIASGNAVTALAGRGVECDIKPPVVSMQPPVFPKALDEIRIETGIGGMEVTVLLN